MKVKVYVTLKSGVLDPQGQAVAKTLGRTGYAEVESVRIGKYIELEIADGTPKVRIENMCRQLLANTVIEDFRVKLLHMMFGIVRFPGSNCDDDAYHLCQNVLADKGAHGRIIWHKQYDVGQVDAIILPGGFSYGDYLRAGAMAAHSPIMASVKRFAEKGGAVLAICNGFQIACEAGLLEGALTRNESLRFECRDVWLRVEGRPTPFTHAIPAGRNLRMSIAHAEGRYVHPDPAKLEAEGRIIFRYVTADGEVAAKANPNGSMANIAGVTNALGNVVGLMPHPERAVEALLGDGGEDGLTLFETFIGEGARV